MPTIQPGDFVRVRADSDFRAGQDGMAVAADDGKVVGLTFGHDRYNRAPARPGSLLVEEWQLGELDLASVEH